MATFRLLQTNISGFNPNATVLLNYFVHNVWLFLSVRRCKLSKSSLPFIVKIYSKRTVLGPSQRSCLSAIHGLFSWLPLQGMSYFLHCESPLWKNTTCPQIRPRSDLDEHKALLANIKFEDRVVYEQMTAVISMLWMSSWIDLTDLHLKTDGDRHLSRDSVFFYFKTELLRKRHVWNLK